MASGIYESDTLYICKNLKLQGIFHNLENSRGHHRKEKQIFSWFFTFIMLPPLGQLWKGKSKMPFLLSSMTNLSVVPSLLHQSVKVANILCLFGHRLQKNKKKTVVLINIVTTHCNFVQWLLSTGVFLH